MQIISHKNSLSTSVSFIQNSYSKDYIKGIVLDIIMIRDDRIIVYSPDSNQSIALEALQGSTIAELNNSQIRELDSVLNYLQGFHKRILINITPLNYPPLSDNTIKTINDRNHLYINKVLSIVNRFPMIDISLHSTSRQLVNIMIQEPKTRKIGLILLPENINYLDTDYYIFSPLMLNTDIMNELLSLGKEVMILIENCNDLTISFFYFFMEQSITKKELLNKVIFVSYYPDILYYLFKDAKVN